jgi:serine/threonine protein kinase
MEPLSANDPRMIGEFRLHSRLGAGGMGQVYLGFSPAGRAVAIKVIHSQFGGDPEFLRRFSHEVTAARAVGGMYTAPVVDSSVTDSSPWLATAYVPGPPLSAVVGRYGALPEAAVWRLAAGLAEALRAVHAAGVIHRDLKPANVLLADDGPHVIDFGISRPFHGTQLTSAGMVIGTPGYMSPEQAKSGPAGPASDIFSLGCVLAYAATGGPPFEGDNAASVLYRIVSTEPDLSAIPPRLRQVIEACLKKDPDQRPEPAQVIAMINALGPETPASLGSFWPAEVARVIATEQSSQTPAGLTPPVPAPYPGSAGSGTTAAAGSGGLSGSTGLASPPPAERTPTALATPTPSQGGGATGHAPMISDGYWAAAAQGGYGPAPAGSSIPPVSSPSQPYSGPQPYGMPPGGQAPAGAGAGQPPAGPGGYGQAVFGQPGLGTSAQYPGQAPSYPGQAPSYPGQAPSYPGQAPSYPGQAPSYPGQAPSYPGQAPSYPGQAPSYPGQAPSYPGQAPSYPGQQPSGADALPGYTPGRRKPMSGEVPSKVHTAIRLMYIGFVVTALDVVLSLLFVGRYTHDANVAKDAAASYTALGKTRLAAAETTVMHSQTTMAGAMVIALAADVLGLACWAWLAMATRRGHGWTRIAGTVLLAIYSVCTLFVLLGTHRDPAPQFTTVVVWALGAAAVIPLWSQQARDFFRAWGRH